MHYLVKTERNHPKFLLDISKQRMSNKTMSDSMNRQVVRGWKSCICKEAGENRELSLLFYAHFSSR